MSATSTYPRLEPGIYFGLDESIYHSDPALSRGDMVHILDTPNTYWEQSWMNPNRTIKRVSDEMVYGRAFHCMLFEPQEFDKRFFHFPTKPWQDGKQMISDEDYDTIQNSIRVLLAGRDTRLFLRGGVAEVTIVYDDDGVRYRTRHDYLGIASTTDMKTARTLEEAYLKKEFRERGIDIQMATYLRSRVRFKEQYAAGEAHVYGKVDKQFFRDFLDEEMNEFCTIFQRKTKPHPFEVLVPEEDTLDSGRRKIEITRRIYKQYMNTYGPNVPWPVSEGRAKRFSMFYGIAN